MCQVCRSYPCDSRCPNAPESKVVGYCEKCDQPIEDGDWCYKFFEDTYYCEECVDRMHTKVRL